MKKLFLFALLFMLNCTQSFEPRGTVSADVKSANLVIQNQTTEIIYYAVFERDEMMAMLWAPVCTPENSLAPNASKRIEITGNSFLPSNQAVVYWWHKGANKVVDTNTFGPDKIHSIVVTVR